MTAKSLHMRMMRIEVVSARPVGVVCAVGKPDGPAMGRSGGRKHVEKNLNCPCEKISGELSLRLYLEGRSYPLL